MCYRTNVPELFYTYSPNGHSSEDYRHSNTAQREKYTEYFLTEAQRLAEGLKMIVSTIAEQDPHALVLVFGDHGAYLSRGITPAEDSDFFMRTVTW